MDQPAHTYFVPVHPVAVLDTFAVRTARLLQGQRVGIAFSDWALLNAAMGAEQQWLPLSEAGLRAMLAPLGIVGIQIDPVLVAAPDARVLIGAGAGRG